MTISPLWNFVRAKSLASASVSNVFVKLGFRRCARVPLLGTSNVTYQACFMADPGERAALPPVTTTSIGHTAVSSKRQCNKSPRCLCSNEQLHRRRFDLNQSRPARAARCARKLRRGDQDSHLIEIAKRATRKLWLSGRPDLTAPGSGTMMVFADEQAYGGKRRGVTRMLVRDIRSELIDEQLTLAGPAQFHR